MTIFTIDPAMIEAMEQNADRLNDLAARLAQRLETDPDHPAAARMRADLDRHRAAKNRANTLPHAPRGRGQDTGP